MSEGQSAIVKMSIAGAGATVSGLTLNEWVALATLVYVVMQTILLIPKFLRWWRGE